MDTLLSELEVQLGANINILRDALDLHIRQNNVAVVRAMQDLDKAWNTLAVLLATEQVAKKQRLTFNAVHDGNSVVDALFHYASEMFPNSLAVKTRNSELSNK